jgi:antirestriction protein ArdC
MATKTSKRADVYSRVTNQIIDKLERGVRPWLQPWNATHAAGRISRPLRSNGEAYKGINVLMLYMAAEMHGYNCPIWMTYRQALALGGHVRKGEHGSPVVYASTFTKTETTDEGQEIEHEQAFLKEYTVFNVCQVEGLPEHFYALAEPLRETMQRIERADAFFANTKADIRHGGNRAYYTVTGDYIQMPPFVAFRDAESHAATLAHELTHWTRHESRLNRDFGRKRFGDEGYAVEELVAELGSSFLCADLTITPALRDDHASYIDHWLKVLKQDKRAIFTAASHASRAVDYLHSLQSQPAA